MTARYSRLPLADDVGLGAGDHHDLHHLGFTFDYSSPFTYNTDLERGQNYKSIFSYSSDVNQQHHGDPVQIENDGHNVIDRACFYIFNAVVFITFVLTFPVSVWFAIKMVPNFERLVVFRWGRLYQTKGPGMVFVMPFVDRYQKVDIRMKAFTVPPQQVITGDRAIIEVGADVYYHIASPERSITNVQNLDKSTRVLLQTSLLNRLVRLPLSKIEGHRNSISQEVQDVCNKVAKAWGVEICRLDLSQIKVLQKPPVNQSKPSVMLPPGLAGLGNFGSVAQSLSSGAVPEAFQQLASAFLSSQGISLATDTPTPKILELASPDVPATPLSPQSAAGALLADSSDSRMTASSGGLSSAMSVYEILQAARCVLSEALVRKVGAVYQFQLHGEQGSVYYMNLKYGCGSIGEGVWNGDGEVDATLMLTVPDLQLLMCGQLKPFQAYMNGRLRVTGDLASAMKLEVFVDRLVARQ